MIDQLELLDGRSSYGKHFMREILQRNFTDPRTGRTGKTDTDADTEADTDIHIHANKYDILENKFTRRN